MESPNQRSDNRPQREQTGGDEYSRREHQGSMVGRSLNELSTPYSISVRLPTYEEATANTNIPISYEHLYGNRPNSIYGEGQSTNLQQLNSSTLPDSITSQEWPDSRSQPIDPPIAYDDEEEYKCCARCSILCLLVMIAFIIIVAKLAYDFGE